MLRSTLVAGVNGSVGVVCTIDGRNVAVIQIHWEARILAGLEWVISNLVVRSFVRFVVRALSGWARVSTDYLME